MAAEFVPAVAHYDGPRKGGSMASPTPVRAADPTSPPSDAAIVMTSAEVAELLHVSQATLCRWRQRGSGPRVLWLSPRVPRYLRADVQYWIERVRS